MNITVEEARVVATKDGVELAEMTFVNSGKFYIIDHTGVSDAARALGVGKKLVASFVDYSREKRDEDFTVMPVCKI